MRCLVLWLLPIGCCVASCWASESQLRMRAASDLDCDPELLSIAERDDVHHVTGCGQAARHIAAHAAETNEA